MAGKNLGDFELPESIFGVEPNKPAMHEAVKNYLANQRQGTQSSLTRAEVSGGGRKPWRQKGTGRARQGSTRAPQWIHGGVAFAPKPREYRYRLNKKLKKLALLSALSSKAAAGEVVVIDKLSMDEIKTRTFVDFLTKVEVTGKSLVVTNGVNENVYKSGRNIKGVSVSPALLINVYQVLNSGKLVVDKDAVSAMEEVFAR